MIVMILLFTAVLPLGGYQGHEPMIAPIMQDAPAIDLSPILGEWRGMIEHAARASGVPVLILAGIAKVESNFRPAPAHLDPLDKGMFGLREVYHEERARLYGEYDPEVPEEAARVAAGILADHYARLGSWPLAVSAYHQGARGLAKNGPRWSYVWKVYDL